MSIPSVKAVEIGNAINGTAMSGSEFQDIITSRENQFVRQSNNMGGIEGGMSNGEDIICRVYHKPLATLSAPLKTIDITTHQTATATVERSDICAVPRAGVIAEAMLTIVLGDAMLEKFGGDHIDETKRNFSAYIQSPK
jgi:chorismate synthase